MKRRWQVTWMHKGVWKSKFFWFQQSADVFVINHWDQQADIIDRKPLDLPR